MCWRGIIPRVPLLPFPLYSCAIKYEKGGKKEMRIPICLVLSIFIFFSGDYFRVSEPVSIAFVPRSYTDYTRYLFVRDAGRIPKRSVSCESPGRHELRRLESPLTVRILRIVAPTIFHERSTVHRSTHQLTFHGYLFFCRESV